MFKAGDKVRLNDVGRSKTYLTNERDKVFTIFKCDGSHLWFGAGEGWYQPYHFELVKENEMKFKVGDYVVVDSPYYKTLQGGVGKIHRVDSPKNIYVGMLDGPCSFEKAGLWNVEEGELVSLMDLDKPFKDLSDEVKVALFTAYIKGAQIQYKYGSRWINMPELSWSPDSHYRIATVAKPDSIDWSQVGNQYKYMARSMDGFIRLYMGKPTLGVYQWCTEPGTICARVSQPSYVQGDVDWKDSLVCR